jgi:hypothetical protein
MLRQAQLLHLIQEPEAYYAAEILGYTGINPVTAITSTNRTKNNGRAGEGGSGKF